MSLGLILIIVLVIFLFGGFSGRFGGYGYGYGHGGVGLIGTILITDVAWATLIPMIELDLRQCAGTGIMCALLSNNNTNARKAKNEELNS